MLPVSHAYLLAHVELSLRPIQDGSVDETRPVASNSRTNSRTYTICPMHHRRKIRPIRTLAARLHDLPPIVLDRRHVWGSIPSHGNPLRKCILPRQHSAIVAYLSTDHKSVAHGEVSSSLHRTEPGMFCPQRQQVQGLSNLRMASLPLFHVEHGWSRCGFLLCEAPWSGLSCRHTSSDQSKSDSEAVRRYFKAPHVI